MCIICSPAGAHDNSNMASGQNNSQGDSDVPLDLPERLMAALAGPPRPLGMPVYFVTLCPSRCAVDTELHGQTSLTPLQMFRCINAEVKRVTRRKPGGCIRYGEITAIGDSLQTFMEFLRDNRDKGGVLHIHIFGMDIVAAPVIEMMKTISPGRRFDVIIVDGQPLNKDRPGWNGLKAVADYAFGFTGGEYNLEWHQRFFVAFYNGLHTTGKFDQSVYAARLVAQSMREDGDSDADIVVL